MSFLYPQWRGDATVESGDPARAGSDRFFIERTIETQPVNQPLAGVFTISRTVLI